MQGMWSCPIYANGRPQTTVPYSMHSPLTLTLYIYHHLTTICTVTGYLCFHGDLIATIAFSSIPILSVCWPSCLCINTGCRSYITAKARQSIVIWRPRRHWSWWYLELSFPKYRSTRWISTVYVYELLCVSSYWVFPSAIHWLSVQSYSIVPLLLYMYMYIYNLATLTFTYIYVYMYVPYILRHVCMLYSLIPRPNKKTQRMTWCGTRLFIVHCTMYFMLQVIVCV